jgi:peptide-methionine (S)-S-oxide reductase
VDASGVVKQSSEESKESNLFCLVILEVQWKIPSYEEVCGVKIGHAESIQIEFDPKIISFEKILDIFWHMHNPTTPNRQDNDIGTQYRSAIFFHNQTQKETAEKLKAELEKERFYIEPIVTEISPLRNFYAAEDYHKNYYEDH